MEVGVSAYVEEEEAENEKHTLPVLFTLPVMLSWSVDLRGSKPGMDPPVAYQLQNAAAVYLLANSL